MIRQTAVALLFTTSLSAQTLPFLTDKEVTQLATEVSGESAMRNLEGFSRQHRMRGSRGFRVAADQIVAELKRYGFTDAHIESLPADGKIYYGTQLSRPAWNAEFAELWELDANGAKVNRVASWDAAPITLAQDSISGEVTAELVDIGAGTADAHYTGEDVKGKLVLTSSQPEQVAALAVTKLGAAGVVSYAQNQRTGWFGEDETLIRWGHAGTFTEHKTFGFMVSLKTARALQARLGRGETIRMHAVVRAGQESGSYDLATATIRGTELPDEEIVFSCHLDHPRPGANDNASGCASILEAARTLSKLIGEKRLPPPRRTIRFVWPPEIEGTLALLNGRPEIAKKIKAAIHLDMVGGGPETKAIFHVTRGPASQPSFVHDLAATVGMFVNDQSAQFAMTGAARWPLVAPTGGKEPLRAALVPLTLGSDHQIYGDSSFAIPAIYLNDWPDRYIHTNKDLPANIDPTKLGRAAFIAATSGYVLARITPTDTAMLNEMVDAFALERRATAMRRRDPNVMKFNEWYEREMKASVTRFFTAAATPKLKPGMYGRNPDVKGPMSAFGYDYFDARYKGEPLRLNGEYRFEALNLVDGQRSAQEIRDALSAIYAPVPLADVEQYLQALASVGVILPSGTAPSASRSRSSP
jgi:aminopeptidase YwaD